MENTLPLSHVYIASNVRERAVNMASRDSLQNEKRKFQAIHIYLSITFLVLAFISVEN